MTFRRRLNRHDAWIAYRDSHAAQIAETRLPVELFETEKSLTLFLTNGF